MRSDVSTMDICGTRKRADQHVNEEAIIGALRDGRASTASDFFAAHSLSRSSSGKWSHENMCAVQAECRLSFAEPGVYAFTMDGAAIGKPHKDYVLIHQQCMDNLRSVV